MRTLRKRLKTLVARYFLVIEFCHDCGRRQPLVWHADDSLWKQVTGGVDGGGAPLCPECFDVRADKMGLLVHWTASLREFHPRRCHCFICRRAGA